jgi:BlaI family transcriptional regulator, penicillinase repressor
MSPRAFEVGPLEMEVLGILDGKSPLSVAEIQRILRSPDRDLAYTTIMTILVRLQRKGFLKRVKEGRQFLYFPAGSKQNNASGLFERVKQTLFRNDRLRPILALLEDGGELTADELRELRRTVEEKLGKMEGR